MKRFFLLLSLTICLQLTAQTVYRIDIDMYGRQTAEVTEPEYTRWEFPKDVYSATLEVGEVTFRIESSHLVRSGWNKALIQAKENNARLTCDGVLLEPNECGEFTLYIKGLSPGRHNIQTYHNAWDDPARFKAWPITVRLGNKVVHQSVPQTLQVITAPDATILTTVFEVTTADEEVALTFSTSEDDAPEGADEAEKKFCSPALNGFLVDAVDATAQAKEPVPTHGDLHVDADNGTCTLSWTSANETVAGHQLYFGIDSVSVAKGDTSSDCFVGTLSSSETSYEATNLVNAKIYYWRVDEVDASGNVSQGKVWKFRPRHLAFPGAEGYGRFANGGRGGRVVYVTNLNSSGPGSFREAIQKTGEPRTILFMVSGIIDLGLVKEFTDDNLTIAGQTAPGKGICLAHCDMGMGDDVICRHMRFRRGWHDEIHGNAMGVTGSDHTIVDHISTSWGSDETISGRGAHNATFQYSTISEALGMGHGFAATIGGNIGSYHHNFLVNCSGRNWSMGGGLDGNGYYSGRMDIFNNVCYNWWKRATDGGAHEVNFVGNYYKMGPNTNKKYIMVLQLEGVGKGTQSVYMHDNIREDYSGTKTGDVFGDTYTYEVTGNQVLDWTPFVEKPFFPSYATVHSANDAYKVVLSNVGATQPMVDDHDRRNVLEALNRSWTYKISDSYKGFINKEEDAGGFEVYPEKSWPENFDTDLDGLPNWWEELHGTNPNSGQDDFTESNSDPDGDGYTMLEDYLNFMGEPHVGLAKDEKVTINLKDYFLGFTANPKYTVTNSSDVATVSVESDTLLVVTGQNNGIAQVTMTVTDAEGSTYDRPLGIAVTGSYVSGIDKTVQTEATVHRFEVFSLDGKTILKGKAHGATVRQLPLGSLPRGIYVIKLIYADGRQETCKMIK